MQDEKFHGKIKAQPFCSEIVGIYRKCLHLGASLHEMVWKSILSLRLSSLGISAATRPSTATCRAGSLRVPPAAGSRGSTAPPVLRGPAEVIM